MKNYDEFRQTVFDKAKKYEAQRKARNKKILEGVSLCSLVIVITLSAYLGLLSFPDQLPDSSSETTTASSATTMTTSGTTTAQSSLTTTKDTYESTIVEWTTTENTHESITVSEWTTEVPQTEATEQSSEESTEFPSLSKLEFRGTAKETNVNIGETELVEIETFEEWQNFRESNLDDYPNLQNDAGKLDNEYFEKHTLVVVRYTGYDVIAFEYHFVPTVEADEIYVLQITLRKNPKNRREQIHVMGVEKDAFQYAEIRVLEK